VHPRVFLLLKLSLYSALKEPKKTLIEIKIFKKAFNKSNFWEFSHFMIAEIYCCTILSKSSDYPSACPVFTIIPSPCPDVAFPTL